MKKCHHQDQYNKLKSKDKKGNHLKGKAIINTKERKPKKNNQQHERNIMQPTTANARPTVATMPTNKHNTKKITKTPKNKTKKKQQKQVCIAISECMLQAFLTRVIAEYHSRQLRSCLVAFVAIVTRRRWCCYCCLRGYS